MAFGCGEYKEACFLNSWRITPMLASAAGTVAVCLAHVPVSGRNPEGTIGGHGPHVGAQSRAAISSLKRKPRRNAEDIPVRVADGV
mmetsp:Transcript_2875/g.8909  ORF Transcript_2875/g.8909 Transcript_2875/m.8909 type:complete len:86 (+) Transcript_2875:1014-1271(+)